MPNAEIPFYTQAAVLSRYAHLENPSADSDALEIVLTSLKENPELRRHFFQSGPSAAWAPILWKEGFFNEPPSPVKTETGYILPNWDVQEYLIDVAAEVPEIVVQFAQSIEGPGWYISRSIRALTLIPEEQARTLVPQVIQWLDDPPTAKSIARDVSRLIGHLTKTKHVDAALTLFDALTAPIPSSNLKTVDGMLWGGEAESKFLRQYHYTAEEFLDEYADLFRLIEQHPERIASILQEHLSTALRLEAEALDTPDFKTYSWWRTAIEDTGQDLDNDYKDWLLRALRKSLETWTEKDHSAVEPLIRQYLCEDLRILRRLGFHMLRRFPTTFPNLVVEELTKPENLDDTSIHHEFFLLLRAGFSVLAPSDQEALIATICKGPPSARVENYNEWAKEFEVVDKEEYIRKQVQFWIRDRLLMLQGHLTGEPAKMLDQLMKKAGKPKFPVEFTSWSSGGYFVKDMAPLAQQELAEMTPEELVKYVREWKPKAEQLHGPERISYRGLANEIAKVILAAPKRYAEHLPSIVLLRPEFPYALLDYDREEKPVTPDAWEFMIGLCETLVEDQTVRNDMSRAFEISWSEVRRSIVNILQIGIKNEQHQVPANLLPRVRDILLLLLDDPDPDEESDQPPEGWFGHEDPITIAINAVRSNALLNLIEYAKLRATMLGEAPHETAQRGPEQTCLESIVREALTRKLDRQKDPSWAVHSVYGRYLSVLLWLDQEWLEAHVDQIFQKDDSEKSIRYFVAAWDAFVVFNRFCTSTFELLQTEYRRAIHNLGQGRVTQSHLLPARSLAIHVTWEYLRPEQKQGLFTEPPRLIALFLQEAPPETRSLVPWAMWQALENSPDKLDILWPRVRAVWEWRGKEASAANHPTEFDQEMGEFTHLLHVAPKQETISSLWKLMEPLLPHIVRPGRRGFGWRIVEEYLASEVARDPLRSIQFYRLMHDQTVRERWHYRRDEPHRIIEQATSEEMSRNEALSLIDLLARRGVNEFCDIYDRYAS
jgi:hypothetical protein